MEAIAAYEHAVRWLQEAAPGADKFVHTYVGLALWLTLAWFARRGPRSPWPVFGVAACEAVNEITDRIAHGTWAWHDTGGDILATLFWPTVLCLAMRSVRFRHGRAPTADHQESHGHHHRRHHHHAPDHTGGEAMHRP